MGLVQVPQVQWHNAPPQGASEPAPFTPAEVNPRAWYQPATLAAFADADPVGVWPDSSGNGRDLIQETGAAQPFCKKAVANGRDVLRLDGVDDKMVALFTNDQPVSVYIVVKLITRPPGTVKYVFDGASNSTLTLFINNDSLTWHLYTDAVLNGPATDVTAFHLITARFDGASSSIRKDDDAAMTGTLGFVTTNGFAIGPGNTGPAYPNCDIAEIVVCPLLDAGDDAALAAYFNSRYGLW